MATASSSSSASKRHEHADRVRPREADLAWLIGRIRDGYGPEKIILFGPSPVGRATSGAT